MSDVSSSSDSPSALGSPGDQILAEEEEEVRVDEPHEAETSGRSIDTNEQDPTEHTSDRPLPAKTSVPHTEPDKQSEPGHNPEIEVEPQAQVEFQPEPQPEPQREREAEPQVEENSEENGTAGQPYSIDDDNAVERNAKIAPPAESRVLAAPSITPGQQPRTDINDDLPPDKVTDGRVRQNPIPNKYISKATKRDGNFGVMQMGHGSAFMDARDLAAKRSSEATQAAAQEAIRNGQNGMARRKHVWKPADPNMAAPPPPQQYTQYQQQGPNQYSQPAYYPPPANRVTGPSPVETKNEQARLLTFLRSLHPVIVVDQLCKALAYFGGIPGAPAPQDPSVFPSSAKGNGQGGLLVGWMAEIFPPADFTKPPFTDFPHNLPNMGYVGPTGQASGHAYDPQGSKNDTPAKRPRGRPKGSKNSKFRKDKGAKRLKPGDVPPHPDGTPWQPGDGNTTVDLTQDTNSSQPAQPSDNATSQPDAPLPPAETTPTKASQADPDSSVATTSGSGTRGRPKGSKSRPKPVPVPNLPAPFRASAAPGPQEQPLASVARAANDVTSTQYQSPYKASAAQRNSSAQETTLSQHARGWVDPPATSPREPPPDSVSEPAAQQASPLVSRPVAANENSRANNSRKRKQQHAPLALPAPPPHGPTPPTQPGQSTSEDQTEQHQLPQTNEASRSKRLRTANGAQPASAASNTNSQFQAPVLSTDFVSKNATPISTSSSFDGQDVISRAPTMRPSPGQMPQQNHQPPSQQQQYQQQKQSQSVSRNKAPQNKMQARQGSYPQQPYTQPTYQNNNGNNSAFAGASGSNSNQQHPYDGEYMNPNQYALSARRAIEDASSFGKQPMYGQFGRR